MVVQSSIEKATLELQGPDLEGILRGKAPLLMFSESSNLHDCGEITGYDISESWRKDQFYLEEEVGKRNLLLELKAHCASSSNFAYWNNDWKEHREIHASLYSLDRDWSLPSNVGEILTPFCYSDWLRDLRKIPKIERLREKGLRLETLWAELMAKTRFTFKSHFEPLGSWDRGEGNEYHFAKGCPDSLIKISDFDAKRAKYVRRSTDNDGMTIIEVRREHYTLERRNSA